MEVIGRKNRKRYR